MTILREFQRSLLPLALITFGGVGFAANQDLATDSSLTRGAAGLAGFDAIQQSWRSSSLAALEEAATRGDAAAQFYLGWKNAEGNGVTANPEAAAKWYRLSAEQGLAEAQCELGWLYERGKGVEKSREAAEKWMRQAAEQRLDRAQFRMGLMAEREQAGPGQVITGNYVVAAEWFEKAAGQGYALAMLHLGDLYYFGHLGHSLPEAARWFRGAAARGDDEAVMRLGELYERDHEDLPQDHAESARWFRIAAEKGNPKAEYKLGVLLLEGKGLPHDLPEAERWLRQAAKDGSAEAEIRLAAIHDGPPERADRTRLTPDDLDEAAGRGSHEARLLLGIAYEEGRGVTRDFGKAAEVYLLAVNNSLPKEHPEALRRLINLYALGNAKPEDPDRLARLLEHERLSVTSAEAQFQAGEMFYRGRPVSEDRKRAVDWFTRAAQNGSAAAMNRIGELWAAGVNGEPDTAEAARWYRRAARQGLAQAQLNLARACLKGEGVGQDRIEACRWLQLAADQNVAEARQLLAELEKTLSEEERAEARRRVQAAAFRNNPPKSP